MAKKAHAMQEIADGGMTQVTKSPLKDQDREVKRIAEIAVSIKAQGVALAVEAISAAIEAGNKWEGFMVRLFPMPNMAREAFIGAIKEATAPPKEMQGGKKATMPQYDDAARAAQASAKTRLAELSKIAEALIAGWSAPDGVKFYIAVGLARTYLRSKATANGEAPETRGAKRKSAVVKLKAYIAKHAKEVGGIDAIAKVVDELRAELG